MKKPTKPLVSYYGGKQKIAFWICQYMPKHTVYVEPFCGGAAVFFKKPWPSVNNTDYYREVLNDSNKELTTLYRVCRDPEKRLKFLNSIQLTPCAKEEHTIAQKQHRNKYHECDDIDIAVSIYISLNMSFANIVNGGWRTGIGGENHAASWMRKVANLPKVLNRLQGVYIECDDALGVIKRWDSPHTFFYCDPPYVGADQGHYAGYSKNDFENLIQILDNIQGSFLLSHYPTPDISIPDSWERFERNRICSAKGRTGYDRSKKQDESKQNRKRTEVLYRKLASVKPRKEIIKLYESGAFDCFPGAGWQEKAPDSRIISTPTNSKFALIPSIFSYVEDVH